MRTRDAEVKLGRSGIAPTEDPQLWAQESVDEGDVGEAKDRQLG